METRFADAEPVRGSGRENSCSLVEDGRVPRWVPVGNGNGPVIGEESGAGLGGVSDEDAVVDGGVGRRAAVDEVVVGRSEGTRKRNQETEEEEKEQEQWGKSDTRSVSHHRSSEFRQQREN